MWAHFLNESDRATYVAETSGQVEAVMSVRRLTHPEAVFELTAIYVHPERFGRGIGSRLHQVFEDGRADDESAHVSIRCSRTGALTTNRHSWRYGRAAAGLFGSMSDADGFEPT